MGLTAAPGRDHQQARRWMAEAKQTSNPVRLFMLALDIKGALERALRANPDDLEVRLDLVRFHAVTPKVAGGDRAVARAQAEEIARRDAPLGAFARGYLAYRDQQFGVARQELKEAVRTAKTAATREQALRWLGWLSQESQQYADAFDAWEALRASDPSALYELGRTSMFCNCERERGRAAIEEYLKTRPSDKEARKVLEKLR